MHKLMRKYFLIFRLIDTFLKVKETNFENLQNIKKEKLKIQ
jgi:hypothetical protein